MLSTDINTIVFLKITFTWEPNPLFIYTMNLWKSVMSHLAMALQTTALLSKVLNRIANERSSLLEKNPWQKYEE